MNKLLFCFIFLTKVVYSNSFTLILARLELTVHQSCLNLPLVSTKWGKSRTYLQQVDIHYSWLFYRIPLKNICFTNICYCFVWYICGWRSSGFGFFLHNKWQKTKQNQTKTFYFLWTSQTNTSMIFLGKNVIWWIVNCFNLQVIELNRKLYLSDTR